MGVQDEQESLLTKIRHKILGRPLNVKEPSLFHKLSLIPLLAWIGLGADGLSSSAYGPDEAFRTIGSHTYLSVFLAIATAFTVFIISYAYSRIIEHFPHGGGGPGMCGPVQDQRSGHRRRRLSVRVGRGDTSIWGEHSRPRKCRTAVRWRSAPPGRDA